MDNGLAPYFFSDLAQCPVNASTGNTGASRKSPLTATVTCSSADTAGASTYSRIARMRINTCIPPADRVTVTSAASTISAADRVTVTSAASALSYTRTPVTAVTCPAADTVGAPAPLPGAYSPALSIENGTTLDNSHRDISFVSYNIFDIYEHVRSTGVPNYEHARCPLPSGLNISAWRKYLYSYHDCRLCDFLEFGWPMDCSTQHRPVPVYSNHTSAQDYPRQVTEYIHTETLYRSLIGPFNHPPFTPWCQTNALMTRPKRDSLINRRVILDLSWPAGFSVNDGIPQDTYLGQPYKLQLPTAEDMMNLIRRHGRGCFMYSRDLARAYRQLRSDPLDWPLLGVMWEQKWYFDISIPFGIRKGAMCCQRTTDGVSYIMSREEFDTLNYIDDFAGVTPCLSSACASFERLRTLLCELGLDENDKKASPPSQVMTWTGIEFDTLKMEARMPQCKINDTLNLVETWLDRITATRSQLRSLLGKLFHIAQCCKPARLFVARMLDTLRQAPARGYTELTTEFKSDLNWFARFLPQYNGIHFIDVQMIEIRVEADSCLTGCGALCENSYYHEMYPKHIIDQNLSICHLELLNIVIAVKTWAPSWSSKRVRILCDNTVAISTLQNARSRDKFLLQCAREIWLLSAIHKFEIVAQHVPGQLMTDADALSRAHINPSLMTKISASSRRRVSLPPDVFDVNYNVI